MKKINLKFGVLILGIAITAYACKKATTLSDDSSDGVELTESANDDRLAEATMSEFGEDVDTTSVGLTRGPLKCGVHKVKRFTDSIIVTTDFDITSQGCNDSVIRKGQVTAKYYFKASKKQLDSIRYTTKNYYRNNVGIKGSKLVVFKDLTSVTISVKDAQIFKPNGTVVTWSSERTRTQIQGVGTSDRTDDQFEITGYSYGVNASNKPYKYTIMSPLLVSIGCPYIQKGSVKIERTGKKDALIEYGNGQCDSSAKLTVGTWSIDIVLRK
jgi:hypothetical protein